MIVMVERQASLILGRFAFGKTPRGPRCARQARQRLTRGLIGEKLLSSRSRDQ